MSEKEAARFFPVEMKLEKKTDEKPNA